METLHYILILLAIFIITYTVTELFEIKARRCEDDDASQMRELKDLKERVAILEQKIKE